MNSSFRDTFRALLLLVLLASASHSSIAADVSVRLRNPPASGRLALALFDSSNAFGDLRDPVRMVVHDIDGRESYSLRDVPEGEYALLVYYDENGNGRMDKNFIGIPKEPLGFSNGYQPKGPPVYDRAVFLLKEGEGAEFDVELLRPLGELGQIGVGVGVLGRSNPYRGASGGVYQFIPAITYNGDNLQIFGPMVQLSLIGAGDYRLAGTLAYRMGVYDEDDSEFLDGMGSPDDTAMLGLALQSELSYGLNLSANYSHDILDAIGGGEARVELGKSFQLKAVRVSPSLALNWVSSDLAQNDFGVSREQATEERPYYELDSIVSPEAGLGLFIEIGDDCILILNASIELLDQEVVDSPIVTKDHVFKGFSAISYVF